MLFKSTIVVAATQFLAAAALQARGPPQVLTAEKVYHTIINESPYLVERTTTIVWTQSASVTESIDTSIPTPTVD